MELLKKYKFECLLVVLSILLNATLFYLFHIKIVNDSHRYLEYATNLQSGFYFDPHNFWYFGYVFFLYVFQSLGVVIFAQHLLSVVAIVYLFKLYLKIDNHKVRAFLAGLVFLFFYEINLWNNYILTESIYVSFTIFLFYSLLSFLEKENKNMFDYFLPVCIVVFTCMIKPTGITFLFMFFLFGYYKLKLKWSLKIAWVLVFLVSAYFLANRMLHTYILIENYQLGEIVYNVSEFLPNTKSNFLQISVPSNLVIPNLDLKPVDRLVLFVYHNPVFFLKLFSLKFFFTLVQIRTYWSNFHNVYNVMILIPLYVGVFWALLKSTLHSDFRLLSTFFLLIYLFIMGLTSVDWDGRFLMPLMPVLIVLGVFGLKDLHSKIKS